VRKNGGLITVQINGRIQYDLNGEFCRAHCLLTDITERKQLEQMLYEQKAMLENKVNERSEELRRSPS
jgi:hypothetical protein